MGRVLVIAERFAKVEEKLPTMTHADSQRIRRAMIEAMRKYVPEEQIETCFEFFRERALRQDPRRGNENAGTVYGRNSKDTRMLAPSTGEAS